MGHRWRFGARVAALALVIATLAGPAAGPARGAITRDQVENAIRRGVRYLKELQRPDGSWPDADNEAQTGTTSLVALSLMTAGEPADSPTITRALDFLRRFTPEQLKSTYAVSLQTMVFAGATPERDQLKIAANVTWLERAQIKPGDGNGWPGTWSYSEFKTKPGDNSNTQYALLALHAASEVGVAGSARGLGAVSHATGRTGPEATTAAGPITPDDGKAQPTASMTCAGRLQPHHHRAQALSRGRRFLVRATSHPQLRQGPGEFNPNVVRGASDWMSKQLPWSARTSASAARSGSYYYLYGLERAGRLSGQRFFGEQGLVQSGGRGAGQVDQDFVGFSGPASNHPESERPS